MQDVKTDNYLSENVLILEKMDSKLVGSTTNNNSYILEGIFAEFDGEKNENGRIYTEKDYLPHLKYLQESIDNSNLLGELDHPEKLEPSLAKASHIIEKLEYDPLKKQVIGRIRLLSNTYGQDARRLLEDGVQLSISSRAVGKVREDKTVDLQKIITYDLVAQPGFKNAQLTKINESLGIFDNNIAIYKVSDEQFNTLMNKENDINQNKIFEESMVNNNEISKIRQEYDKLYQLVEEKNETISNLNIKIRNSDKRLEKIENYLKEFTEEFIDNESNVPNSKEIDSIKNRIKLVESYLNTEVGNPKNDPTKIHQYLDNEVNPTIEKIQQYLDTQVFESHNELTNEIEIIKEYLEQFTTKYNHQLENIAPYLDYMAETVQEGVSNIEKYSDEISSVVTSLENYNDVIHNEIDNLTEYVKYSNKVTNDYMTFQESINENLETKTVLNKSLTYNNFDNNSPEYILENNQDYIQNKGLRLSEIKNSFNKILESVTNKKQEVVNESNVNAYLSLVSNQKRNEFLTLDGDVRKNITKEILNSKPVNESQVLAIMERQTSPKTNWDVNNDLLQFLPKNLIPIFENLDQNVKDRIFEEAKLWDLSNDRMKTNFWLARKSLFESNTSNLYLNENIKLDVPQIQDDYMKMIAAKLNSMD